MLRRDGVFCRQSRVEPVTLPFPQPSAGSPCWPALSPSRPCMPPRQNNFLARNLLRASHKQHAPADRHRQPLRRRTGRQAALAELGARRHPALIDGPHQHRRGVAAQLRLIRSLNEKVEFGMGGGPYLAWDGRDTQGHSTRLTGLLSATARYHLHRAGWRKWRGTGSSPTITAMPMCYWWGWDGSAEGETSPGGTGFESC